ncbi:hypothetical protein [Neobacillus sp. CF12]|uniref:hypothetical protein n=1 Tax=Neobacillus sp. CF12 TaxID=3055864 RepID=UPI0025A2C282|nr:hypothetical protein [Neobacillus sp. CF12]MDM5326812.1 hypothetical protein [Neobacillus sp. CF12]
MGLLEQRLEVMKECGLEVRNLANNRFNGWFEGRAIVQQLHVSGTGYVPGSLVQKVTSEFNGYLDDCNMIPFEKFSTEKFSRLLEVAKAATARF